MSATVLATFIGGPEDGGQRTLPEMLPSLRVPRTARLGLPGVVTEEGRPIAEYAMPGHYLYSLVTVDGEPSKDAGGRLRYRYCGEMSS